MRELRDSVIQDRLRPYGVSIDARVVGQIGRYLALLAKWNQRVNLTGIEDPEEILERHFGESMFAARVVRLDGRLADVGSGAGFPGLALKLLFPNIDVTLIESSHKKAAFMSEVCRELKLDGVRVLAERMENVEPGDQAWNFVTSRAVGNVRGILDWARGTMTPGGRIVLWVGVRGVEEARRTVSWRWEEAVVIPKSRQRFILIGSVA